MTLVSVSVDITQLVWRGTVGTASSCMALGSPEARWPCLLLHSLNTTGYFSSGRCTTNRKINDVASERYLFIQIIVIFFESVLQQFFTLYSVT